MKIRTLLELSDAIDAETAWRQQELSVLVTGVKASSGVALNVSVRSAVALLYAHWEGWIKSTAKLYVIYVNSQRLHYDQLSAAWLGNALKVKMDTFKESSRADTHRQFANVVLSGLQARASVSEDLVRSDSNLNSVVLGDITNRLDLASDFFATKSHMIDVQLLKARNNIAHGDYLDVDAEDYLLLHDAVLNMLREFTNRLLNAATERTYLRTTHAP